MGADIHLYLERKVDGKWEELKIDENLFPDERHYSLFGFLANVRGDGGHFADRGFPADTSYKEIRDEAGDCDNWMGSHSFTYAYLDELHEAPWKELDDPEENYRGMDCYFASFIFQVLPRLTSPCGFLNTEERRNIRILMGFDS